MATLKRHLGSVWKRWPVWGSGSSANHHCRLGSERRAPAPPQAKPLAGSWERVRSSLAARQPPVPLADQGLQRHAALLHVGGGRPPARPGSTINAMRATLPGRSQPGREEREEQPPFHHTPAGGSSAAVVSAEGTAGASFGQRRLSGRVAWEAGLRGRPVPVLSCLWRNPTRQTGFARRAAGAGRRQLGGRPLSGQLRTGGGVTRGPR